MLVMKNELVNYLNKDKLIKIYGKSQDNDVFATGYLVADLDKYYIFQFVDDTGCLDSYVLYKKNEIRKIISDDNFLKTLSFYVNYVKEHNEFDRLNLKKAYDSVPKDSITSILKYCCDQNLYITIAETEDDYDETIRVVSIDSEKIFIDQKAYCEDYDMPEEVRETPIKINNIQTLDIVSKENYLYDQYSKQK